VTLNLEPELVATIVAAQFPELRPVRVAYLGEGYDSTAFDVNGYLVFRFPKRADVDRQLAVETSVLPLLAVGTPVPIPSYSFQGVPSSRFPRHFAGYARLTGVPGIGVTPTQTGFLRLAPVLGDFLSFLHSFPVGTAAQLDVPVYPSDVLIGEVRAEALSDLGEWCGRWTPMPPRRNGARFWKPASTQTTQAPEGQLSCTETWRRNTSWWILRTR
jgi:hypothetical protein